MAETVSARVGAASDATGDGNQAVFEAKSGIRPGLPSPGGVAQLVRATVRFRTRIPAGSCVCLLRPPESCACVTARFVTLVEHLRSAVPFRPDSGLVW
jgi:hypothetical protein